MIDKPILELLTFGQNPFLVIWDPFFLILGPRDPVSNPFQPISRPCSIEKVYAREWRIAIPASLMRVEKAPKRMFLHFFILFQHVPCIFGPNGAKYREKGWAASKIGEG